jgi:hypothetical protein
MSSTHGVSGGAAPAGFAGPSAGGTLDERIGEQWYQPRIARPVLKELMKRSDISGFRSRQHQVGRRLRGR